jgi:hypothetical protein
VNDDDSDSSQSVLDNYSQIDPRESDDLIQDLKDSTSSIHLIGGAVPDNSSSGGDSKVSFDYLKEKLVRMADDMPGSGNLRHKIPRLLSQS